MSENVEVVQNVEQPKEEAKEVCEVAKRARQEPAEGDVQVELAEPVVEPEAKPSPEKKQAVAPETEQTPMALEPVAPEAQPAPVVVAD